MRRETIKNRETTGPLKEIIIIIAVGTAGVVLLSSLPFIMEKLLFILK